MGVEYIVDRTAASPVKKDAVMPSDITQLSRVTIQRPIATCPVPPETSRNSNISSITYFMYTSIKPQDNDQSDVNRCHYDYCEMLSCRCVQERTVINHAKFGADRIIFTKVTATSCPTAKHQKIPHHVPHPPKNVPRRGPPSIKHVKVGAGRIIYTKVTATSCF